MQTLFFIFRLEVNILIACIVSQRNSKFKLMLTFFLFFSSISLMDTESVTEQINSEEVLGFF